ncbi:putative mannose-binding protein C-like [Penaeus vannamei]|uniref:Putative mannose-binding protein C-like n=1 Tax=Penaeus vannamei TaxID=6689 RepID=A0A3R7NVX3_PENVA|nr:putative mannose-binding protein C-like [Penaeus vannamei]
MEAQEVKRNWEIDVAQCRADLALSRRPSEESDGTENRSAAWPKVALQTEPQNRMKPLVATWSLLALPCVLAALDGQLFHVLTKDFTFPTKMKFRNLGKMTKADQINICTFRRHAPGQLSPLPSLRRLDLHEAGPLLRVWPQGLSAVARGAIQCGTSCKAISRCKGFEFTGQGKCILFKTDYFLAMCLKMRSRGGKIYWKTGQLKSFWSLGDKFILFAGRPFTKTRSNSACRYHKAKIFLPQNAEENDFIAARKKRTWLGMTKRKEGFVRDRTGEPVVYTNWQDGEPSNENDTCAIMDQDGFWYGADCSLVGRGCLQPILHPNPFFPRFFGPLPPPESKVKASACSLPAHPDWMNHDNRPLHFLGKLLIELIAHLLRLQAQSWLMAVFSMHGHCRINQSEAYCVNLARVSHS